MTDIANIIDLYRAVARDRERAIATSRWRREYDRLPTRAQRAALVERSACHTARSPACAPCGHPDVALR